MIWAFRPRFWQTQDPIVAYRPLKRKVSPKGNRQGGDPQAADPAVVIAENGTIFLDAGDGNGTDTEDASQITWALPIHVDSGGFFYEIRLNVQDIAECSVNVGLIDVNTLQESASIAAGSITTVAVNACIFVMDSAATSADKWYMVGVDGNTDATGNAATSVGPTNEVFQVLRCEIASDGESAEFFIDGVSVGSLSANVIAASTNMYLSVCIVGDAANSAATGLTIDYIKYGNNR